MSTRKILALVIFGIIAVMIVTAVVHLIAGYVAALFVIWCIVRMWIRPLEDKSKRE